MTGVKLAAAGLLLAVMTLMLKKSGFTGDRVFALVGTVAILIFSADGLEAVLSSSLNMAGGETAEDVRAIMKIIGTGYVFGICADACLELSEKSIANAVSLAGRIEILLLALPYIEKIFRLGEGLLSA